MSIYESATPKSETWEKSKKRPGETVIYQRHITYSLKALAYLAAKPVNTVINVKDMAEELDIPRHFLGKVLTDLVKKQLVVSAKGPTGGFKLAESSKNLSIYELLATLGGLSKLESSCIMGLDECVEEKPCALHESWIEFKKSAVLKTQRLTLGEFSQNLSDRIVKRV
ncbi:MAG TPA: Rrf2 family transcriptional regulator [candidate division Zixibacteria bacterium]|nr:Rrf2 family transcriptional regulator [candidate division Zixibacteria bacterium]